MEKIRGLYKITNEYSGLFYIGKSVDIYKRWITHKKDFENGTHSGELFSMIMMCLEKRLLSLKYCMMMRMLRILIYS